MGLELCHAGAHAGQNGIDGVGDALRFFSKGRQMFPAHPAKGAPVFGGHLIFGRGGELLGQTA